MNFSFVRFGVAGIGRKCMSCPQAGECNMITNKQTSDAVRRLSARIMPRFSRLEGFISAEWLSRIEIYIASIRLYLST
jgi:hypothetical protein